MMKSNFTRLSAAGVAVVLFSACTTVPVDGGISKVEALAAKQLKRPVELPTPGLDTRLTEEDVLRMLEQPLILSDAERLSLELNPGVKASLSQVGIAEADYAQAGRLENPGFTYERFSGEDYAASLLFDVGGLFLLPLKRRLESRRLERAGYEAAAAVLAHLAATRRAWINAVAQRQQTALMERTVESAQTGNSMTRQMTALGHSSVLESAESEILLGELGTALSKQRLAEGAAKEALIRQLGLWGDRARVLQIPERLPELPEKPLKVKAVEREAIERRLDVQMARLNIEGMARNLRLTRWNPFFSAVELGPVVEAAEGEKERGFELEFRVPIFDSGGVKTRKAKIIVEQAQAQAVATAIAAASEAREAFAAYHSTWEIAKHYRDELLPLRQRVSQENLLRYNGMLISVFDLLADVRSAAGIESNYVNALRDFWLADANLQSAITGAGSARMNFEAPAMMSAAAEDAGH